MFDKTKNAITNVIGRGGLVLKKHSPEIFMGVAIISFVATVVAASKAAVKTQTSIEEIKKERKEIDEHTDSDAFESKSYKKEVTQFYVKSGLKVAKNYIPTATFAALSITSMLCSYNIVKKRNFALMAAYKALEEETKKLRLVKKDDSEDHEGEVQVATEEDIQREEFAERNGYKPSMYARFFDETNPDWCKSPEMNLYRLRQIEQWANDKLNARGHVFLNEIYDELGIPRSQAGAVVGWVKDGPSGYIDFGLYNEGSERARDFINGIERSILLDFNVDGVIYDLI